MPWCMGHTYIRTRRYRLHEHDHRYTCRIDHHCTNLTFCLSVRKKSAEAIRPELNGFLSVVHHTAY